MNELRNGVNTRLEIKNNFNDKNNFYSNRNIQDQNFIKPKNQEDLTNFGNFNDKDTISLEKYKFKEKANNISENILKKNNIPETILSKNINPKYDKLFNPKDNLTKISNIRIESDIKKNIYHINKETYKENLLKTLKKVFNKRNINLDDEIIDKFITRYNISYENPDPNILIQLVTDFKLINSNKLQNNLKENKQFINTDDTVIRNYLLSIDTFDRDLKKYENPNDFRIDFTVDNNTTDEKKLNTFDNVISVQLISAIFPKDSINNITLEDYPYIILEIDELGSNYKSTNKFLSKAFAQLTFDIDMGRYKKLIPRNTDEYKKQFSPSISLESFTIKIRIPSGELYDFKEINLSNNIEINNHTDNQIDEKNNINELKYDPNNLNIYNIENNTEKIINTKQDKFLPINFIFKITCIQKKFDNILTKYY